MEPIVEVLYEFGEEIFVGPQYAYSYGGEQRSDALVSKITKINPRSLTSFDFEIKEFREKLGVVSGVIETDYPALDILFRFSATFLGTQYYDLYNNMRQKIKKNDFTFISDLEMLMKEMETEMGLICDNGIEKIEYINTSKEELFNDINNECLLGVVCDLG